MRRRTLITITLGLLAIATAPVAAARLSSSEAANRAAARADAVHELALVRLSPGAVRVATEPVRAP